MGKKQFKAIFSKIGAALNLTHSSESQVQETIDYTRKYAQHKRKELGKRVESLNTILCRSKKQ